jgi:hypothetical protein
VLHIPCKFSSQTIGLKETAAYLQLHIPCKFSSQTIGIS